MLLDVDPELSVLLAQEARVQFEDTEEAQDVIRLGLLSLSSVAGALEGHKDKVSDAAFSQDGRYVLTSSADGTARLWDAGTKAIIKQW
jgi:WD40 repeat protein